MRPIATLALLCGLLLFAVLAQIVPDGRAWSAPIADTAALQTDSGDPGGLFASDDDPIAHLAASASLARPRRPQIAPRTPTGDSIDLTPPGPVPRGA
jgi:hypothetical protein